MEGKRQAERDCEDTVKITEKLLLFLNQSGIIIICRKKMILYADNGFILFALANAARLCLQNSLSGISLSFAAAESMIRKEC